MARVKLTRAQVIEAIKTEPVLRPGGWMTVLRPRRRKDGSEAVPALRSRDCAVCAVGSVLRRVVLHEGEPAFSIRTLANRLIRYYDAAPGVEELDGLAKGRTSPFTRGRELLRRDPLAAVSYVFEGFADLERVAAGDDLDLDNVDYRFTKQQIESIRAATVRFVEDHFPEDVVIDIDGFAHSDKVQEVP